VAGWKAFAPIIAPVPNASPEKEGIRKNMNRKEMKNRVILVLPFTFEIFMVSSGNSKILHF